MIKSTLDMTAEHMVLSKEEALRRLVPSESDIPTEALNRIVPLLEQEVFAAGYRIVVQGEPGNAMYFIAAGAVKVTRSPFGIGEPQQIAVLFRGDIVGEMALVNNQPRNATVTVLEEATVYTLNRSNWIHIQAFYPGLASKIEQVAQRREEYNQGKRVL